MNFEKLTKLLLQCNFDQVILSEENANKYIAYLAKENIWIYPISCKLYSLELNDQQLYAYYSNDINSGRAITIDEFEKFIKFKEFW